MCRKKPPCFFFSYARKDKSPWLDKFYSELEVRVAQKGQLDDEKGEVSFRDVERIIAGDDWPRELSEALAQSLTMVSIYTPWYFIRPYCGKEFQVFLDRQNVRYEEGAARDSRNIVPVLWEKITTLCENDCPHIVASKIDYSLSNNDELYKEHGLQLIRQTKRKKYLEILDELSDIIIQRARRNPLDPMQEIPTLSNVKNAFEKSYKTDAVESMGANSLFLVFLTAKNFKNPKQQMNKYGETHPGDWYPFETEEQEILHVTVKEIASQLNFNHFIEPNYDLKNDSIQENIKADLEKVTGRNSASILFWDPWLLYHDRGYSIFKSIMNSEKWRGGIVLPIDVNDADTIEVFGNLEGLNEILESNAERIVHYSTPSNIKAFTAAFITLLADILKQIALDGMIHNKLEGSGPKERPILRGPARRHINGNSTL